MSHGGFVHLRVHSAYSLAEGAIKIKDLVKRCAQLGMPAVAVTDTNNLFGAMEFAVEAQKAGIQPIIGVQIDVGPDRRKLVLLVQNAQGYLNLSQLVSEAYLHGDPQQPFFVDPETIRRHADGLIALCGGPDGVIGASLPHNPAEAAQAAQFWSGIFAGRFYIEIQRHGEEREKLTEPDLLDIAYAQNIPLAATNDAYFLDPDMHEAHDALLCIAAGRYITEDDRRRVTAEHCFRDSADMAEAFEDLPEALNNTIVIAQRCAFLLEPVNTILPAFPTEKGRSEFDELAAQARAGLAWRLEGKADTAAYKERLEFELDVIKGMGFPGYFLIVSDFIRWAKDQGIPVGPGRGSGAGSVVAWALRITDLDPLEHNLLFERFLNPERISMPDFDIDFCQERRDEVIRYVQDKYGHDRVAQIITFGKLQARAVVRDVGRVLQMPYGLVDRIAKLIPNNPAAPVTLAEALAADVALRTERDRDDTSRKLIDIALQLEGLYRHASTHAAGVVIGDRALHELVPLYRDPRSTMPVTQFNMKYVESAGLIKFDFLGLKTMTVIQKTLELITLSSPQAEPHDVRRSVSGDPAQHGAALRAAHESLIPDHGSTVSRQSGMTTGRIDLLKIPLDDSETYELIRRGNMVGVFQMESAGMRDAIRRVRPTVFGDLVALNALYRPGPMDSIPDYADIKNGKKSSEYLHPKLEQVLKDTFGIMTYQEDVMQTARALAGYTLGGADLLRRAMGKKIKIEMDAQREKFIEGAKKHSDIHREKAEEIFERINKFAGYGFPKAHAAAYALIAYWTAWLKARHPLEFMAASMTLDLGNTDKLAVFKQDLDRMNVTILPPDINRSQVEFSVEDGGIRYALAALKNVGAQAMAGIVAERERGGPFASLNDFAARLDPSLLNKRQIEHLAAAGAFDALSRNRAQTFAAAETILRHAQRLRDERESGQSSLFGGADSKPEALDIPAVKEWDPMEKLAREFGAVGFYLSAHPLDSRRTQLGNLGITNLRGVEKMLADKPAVRASMAAVLLRRQEKISAKGNKFAFLQLSDPTGVYEATMFSDTLAQSRAHLEAGTMLLLSVDAEQREDQVRFTIQKVEPLDKILENRIREIGVYMDSTAAVPKLRQFLDIENKDTGRGSMEIALYMDIGEGRTARLLLPGKWSLSPQARNVLRAEPGVREVREG